MEEFKKKSGADLGDKEIIFSQSIKAGKRIYYLDVKKNRKDELFLAVTESKKIVSGGSEEYQVNFEKHKIFLYQEDFEKFLGGLNKAIDYINKRQVPQVKPHTEAPTDEANLVQEATEEGENAAETPAEDINLGKIDIEF